MTIQRFIEAAIEGGWKLNARTLIRLEPSPWPNDTVPFVDVWTSCILLDPEAWKAVGKVEGWTKSQVRAGSYIAYQATWLDNMHRMIDALAEGRSVEEYLETL